MEKDFLKEQFEYLTDSIKKRDVYVQNKIRFIAIPIPPFSKTTAKKIHEKEQEMTQKLYDIVKEVGEDKFKEMNEFKEADVCRDFTSTKFFVFNKMPFATIPFIFEKDYSNLKEFENETIEEIKVVLNEIEN